MTYIKRYPELTEEPTRREGATGPERPKWMRPDGAVCSIGCATWRERMGGSGSRGGT